MESILGIVLPVFGKKTKPARTARTARTQTSNSYACVEIRYGRKACEAVQAIEGQRFLCAEAPRLPLQACDAACTCTYVHHADRRHQTRRSPYSKAPADGTGARVRRSGVDRRKRATAKH